MYKRQLRNFLRLQPPFDELAHDHSYPPFELRLKFIAVQLNSLSRDDLKQTWNLDAAPLAELSETAVELFEQFRQRVMDILDKFIFQRLQSWREDNQTIWELSQALKTGSSSADVPDGIPFRSLPSAVCISKFTEDPSGEFDSREAFRSLHGAASARLDKPGWVQGETNWVFSEEYLPALRPTLLCSSRNFKVPPTLLLTSHQEIAFIGATNWQLNERLEEAFELRDCQPWDKVQVMFASDALLANTDYGARESKKFEDRDEALRRLQLNLEEKGWARSWEIYQFAGPPIFASYWDWDRQGGRIHASPALLGTAIGRCPGSDFVWGGDEPTDIYNKHVIHLNHLLESATMIASNC